MLRLALAAALSAPPGPAPEGPPPEAPPPTAVPKIPSPRAMAPPEAGVAPVTEDSFGALGLTRQRDGTLLYVDPGKRFTAAFNDDGTVRFGDRWGRDQDGRRMRGSGWALMQANPGGLALGGPSEWLLALQDRMGGPERHGAAKREFLARTAEVRTRMTIAWTLQLLDYRLRTLEQELEILWGAAGSSPAARRELLFQRWDECDEAFNIRPAGEITEEAASALDRARVDTAEKARRVIEGFVRRRLPQKGKDAFTAAELADMNQRRTSQQPFQPYAPSPR